jgi:uncharacterized repeat protein (TIGR02543 family)
MKKYFLLLLITLMIFGSCETEEPIITYTLSITISPTEGGKINVSPESPTYKEGDVVILTPEPNEHWVFQKWEGDGSGSTTPLQITMNSNKSVVGVFVKRDYPLNLTIEGEGTVEERIVTNPNGREYPHGTTVELTPIPKEGWVFDSWGGDLSGSETPKTITVDKEKNVTVKFKRRDYPLNIIIEGEGTVEERIVTDPNGRQYPFETVVELIPIPKDGWVFESWGGDLTGAEIPQTITVDKEKSVMVKFKMLDKSKLSFKLENTVWIGDENYQPCDCGFSGLVGFKGSRIYELSEFGQKEPIGCFPYNFLFRDYNGEIKNLITDEDKISFNIIAGTWDWFTEIEMINEKLIITSFTELTSGSMTWVQQYNLSTISFEEFCK